ncbi:MAG: hypothetical protein ACFFCM_01785 [Promethearchaeota archaeon]
MLQTFLYNVINSPPFINVVLRDLAVGLHYLIITMMGALFVYMLKEWIVAYKDRIKVQLVPGWMTFFLCYCITAIISLISDMYLGPGGMEEMRLIFLNISYTITMVGVVTLVYVFETNLKMNTKGFFWKIGFILTAITAFLPREPSRMILSISVPGIFVPFMFLVLYYCRSFLFSSTGRPIMTMFFGFMIGACGDILRTQSMVETYGYLIYIFGGFFNVFGLLLFGFSAITLRSMEELEWPQAIKNLYILYKSSGVPIFSYDFLQEKTSEVQVKGPIMIAGGLSGVQTILKEISKSSKNVNYIDHGDFSFMFTHGESVLMILFTKKYLDMLKWKMDHLLKRIESIYKDNLVNFEGDIAPFKGIRVLVEEEFSKVGR